MKTIKEIQQSLNNNSDFIHSDFYCVINPGLSLFNQDQIITHNELLTFLQHNNLNTINILPHLT